MKRAFTLAEILITLGIIGVVAAITIPNFMTKINDKVTSVQKTVMMKKLVDGLNLMSNREYGLSVTYGSTEEFVRALSKYLKMITICGKDNLTNCTPYAKINYDRNGELKTIDVSSITSASKLKLEGNWLDPAGFVLVDGSHYIVSYNNDCGSLTDDNGRLLVDPDRPLKNIPAGCIDGLYDLNKSKNPNKYGEDILPFFSANVGNSCLTEINNLCIMTNPIEPTPMTLAECNANKSTYGISGCHYPKDYWAGAMKMCKDQGLRLPTESELTQIANYLYNKSIASTGGTGGPMDTSKIPKVLSGLGSSWDTLWLSTERDAGNAYSRSFRYIGTSRDSLGRDNWHVRVVCVGD